MKSIVYATSNKYKLSMARASLRGFDIELEELRTGFSDVPEIQDESQEAVAIDKANKYFQQLDCPLVVMDSGLFIEELSGFPGVYTRYALSTIKVEGLLSLLQGKQNRRAYTERTVVYIDGQITQAFSSRCHGSLLDKGRGENGQDYDFFFLPDDSEKTVAQMDEIEKSQITGEAWRQFGEWLKEKK